MKIVLSLVGLVLGIGVLSLQLWLTLSARIAAGDTLLDALVFYFSFFTILSNLLLVLCYLAELAPRSTALAFLRTPGSRTATAGIIILVVIVYVVVLAPLAELQGLSLLCDIILHYVAPAVFLLHWALFTPHGMVRFADMLRWFIFPVVYLAYALARGRILGEYPYPFLVVEELGWIGVATNALVLLVLLSAIFAALVAVDGALGGRFSRAR